MPLAHVRRRPVVGSPLKVENGSALGRSIGEVAADHVKQKRHGAVPLTHQGFAATDQMSVEKDVCNLSLRLCVVQVVQGAAEGLALNGVQGTNLGKPAERRIFDRGDVQQGRVISGEKDVLNRHGPREVERGIDVGVERSVDLPALAPVRQHVAVSNVHSQAAATTQALGKGRSVSATHCSWARWRCCLRLWQ